MSEKVSTEEREMGAWLTRASRNGKWAVEHSEELEPHAGRYVAIDKGKVLAVSDDQVALYRRFEKRRGVLVHYVWPRDLGRVLLVGAG